ADWGLRTVDAARGYWIRLRCTHTPAGAPRWTHVWKEQYLTDLGAGVYTVPGWDPRNDPSGDGWVSDAELAARVNPACAARFKYQARVPTFGWVPQRMVANVGDPLYRQLNADWQVDIATRDMGGGQRLNGVFEDNCVSNDGSIQVQSGTQDMADSLHVGRNT